MRRILLAVFFVWGSQPILAQGDSFTDAENWTDVTPATNVLLQSYSRAGGNEVTFTFRNPGEDDIVALRSNLQLFSECIAGDSCGEFTFEVFQAQPVAIIWPADDGIQYLNADTAWWGTLVCVVGSDLFNPSASQATTAYGSTLSDGFFPYRDFRYRAFPDWWPGGPPGDPPAPPQELPRIDGASPISGGNGGDGPTFDSNADGIDDVILWADGPGQTDVATGPTGQTPIAVAGPLVNPPPPPVFLYMYDDDLLFMHITNEYQIKSFCITATGGLSATDHTIVSVSFGNRTNLEIGKDLGPNGPDSTTGYSEAFLPATPIVKIHPNVDLSVIPNALENGDTMPLGAKLEQVLPVFP